GRSRRAPVHRRPRDAPQRNGRLTKAKKRATSVRNHKPRNETSAGGVVFRTEGTERLYLLIRDSYQNWGFPKGHLEHGEQPEAAALREVREETGLSALEL